MFVNLGPPLEEGLTSMSINEKKSGPSSYKISQVEEVSSVKPDIN